MQLFLKFLNEKKIEIHTLSVWFLKKKIYIYPTHK